MAAGDLTNGESRFRNRRAMREPTALARHSACRSACLAYSDAEAGLDADLLDFASFQRQFAGKKLRSPDGFALGVPVG